jgi:hypothetical protein
MDHVFNNNFSCSNYKHSVVQYMSWMFLPMLKLLSTIHDFHTSYGFPYWIIYNKQIYLHGARSGFEPESPVYIRTWTWNAGNSVVESVYSTVRTDSLYKADYV